MIEILSITLQLIGAFFYFAGTLGMLRLPDVYTRLQALSKADNVGLCCVVFGLALQAESLAAALKLLLIWPLMLVASGGIGYAIARRADMLGIAPWRKDKP